MANCPHCNGKFEEGGMLYPCKKCGGSLCMDCYFKGNCKK